MKAKLLILLLIFTIGLTSCSNEETIETNEIENTRFENPDPDKLFWNDDVKMWQHKEVIKKGGDSSLEKSANNNLYFGSPSTGCYMNTYDAFSDTYGDAVSVDCCDTPQYSGGWWTTMENLVTGNTYNWYYLCPPQ